MAEKTLKRALSANSLLLILPLTCCFCLSRFCPAATMTRAVPELELSMTAWAKATDHLMIPPMKALKEPRMSLERW